MAKKQKAESELTEITIHGVKSQGRADLHRKRVAMIGHDEGENNGPGEVSVSVHVLHDDPDLDTLLAPGGKYSVTIRREEG